MNLCNDTITVFNKRVTDGAYTYLPTTITGVSWYATDAVTVDASKGGLVAANKVTVRIPEASGAAAGTYADPLAYADAESVTGLWTLAEGDIIVKGVLPEPEPTPDPEPQTDAEQDEQSDDAEQGDTESESEPTPEPTPPPPWTPARLKAAYADCMTVLAVTDNRRAPNAPHWRVTGS